MKEFTYNGILYRVCTRNETTANANPHIEELKTGIVPENQKHILRCFLLENGFDASELIDAENTTHMYVSKALKVPDTGVNNITCENTLDDIDFKKIFDFIYKYNNQLYAQPNKRQNLLAKNKINEDNIKTMEIIDSEGEYIKESLNKIGNVFSNIYKDKTKRELKRVGDNRFSKQNIHVNSGSQVRDYVWCQLVDKEYKSVPFSLSIFFSANDNAQYIKVCIEMNNNKAKSNENAKKLYEEFKIDEKLIKIYRDDNMSPSEYSEKIIDGFNSLIIEYMNLLGINFSGGIVSHDAIDVKNNIDSKENTNFDSNENKDLNIILYGPPGTGKTYNTRAYAVAICDNRNIEDILKEDYNTVISPRYDQLVREERVKFITFHQSYGYEEFIEGIFPNLDDNSKDISYSLKDGVFKDFCLKASRLKSVSIKDIEPNARVFKVALGRDVSGKIKNDCFNKGLIRIDFNEDEAVKKLDYLSKGDIVLSIENKTSINGIGVVISDDIITLEDEVNYKYAKRVKWLLTNVVIDIKDKYNDNKILPIKTIAALPSVSVESVIEMLQNNNVSIDKTVNNDNYVFIIDEINRGNISKIFGELITLIEPSKRKGNSEELSTILPYSNLEFSVPKNVYLLGTMNTADRSIAIMDTALRRRFKFVEMMPDSNVLDGIVVDGINIKNLLDTINSRIKILYDRDHTIGHAFFRTLSNSSTLLDLAEIFRNKIIPLLQEYFYEDYNKIRLILGDNDKELEFQFITETKNNSKSLFKGNVTNDEIPEYSYEINESAFTKKESYEKII